MTPISAMTNSELDRLIAERRGWTLSVYGLWTPPGKVTMFDELTVELPSFTTDPRYAFELLEEIGHNSSVINCQADHTGYQCFVRNYPTDTALLIMTYSEKSLTRAIAEAWAEWKGGE